MYRACNPGSLEEQLSYAAQTDLDPFRIFNDRQVSLLVAKCEGLLLKYDCHPVANAYVVFIEQITPIRQALLLLGESIPEFARGDFKHVESKMLGIIDLILTNLMHDSRVS